MNVYVRNALTVRQRIVVVFFFYFNNNNWHCFPCSVHNVNADNETWNTSNVIAFRNCLHEQPGEFSPFFARPQVCPFRSVDSPIDCTEPIETTTYTSPWPSLGSQPALLAGMRWYLSIWISFVWVIGMDTEAHWYLNKHRRPWQTTFSKAFFSERKYLLFLSTCPGGSFTGSNWQWFGIESSILLAYRMHNVKILLPLIDAILLIEHLGTSFNKI